MKKKRKRMMKKISCRMPTMKGSKVQRVMMSVGQGREVYQDQGHVQDQVQGA